MFVELRAAFRISSQVAEIRIDQSAPPSLLLLLPFPPSRTFTFGYFHLIYIFLKFLVLWGKIPNISSRVNITELPSAAVLPFVRFSERERSSFAPQILRACPAGCDRNARCRVCKPHGCTRIALAAFSAGLLRVSSQVRAEMERVASGNRDVPEATGSSAGQRTGKRRGGFGHGNP